MPIQGTFKKRRPPTAPSGLNSPSQTLTTVDLAWTNNHALGSADAIVVFKDGTIIEELGPDAAYYTVTGLGSGETNTYVVGATNSSGTGLSDSVSVSTLSGSAPVIISHPSNKSVEDGDTVTFQVSATNADSYQWQVSTDSGSSWADVTGATASYYSFVTVVADDGKQYRCVASNDFGSTYSSSATLSVSAASGLVAVSDLSVAVASASQADLTWTDANASETSYLVYRDNSLIHTTAANAESYSDTGATPGSTHVYRVDVTDGADTLAGNEVTVTMAGPQIASSPTDEWIPDGGTAVFGVAMAPDQGTVTYQWESSTDSGGSWGDVAGATSAYLEDTYAAADNGTLFRCKCTTGAGTVTSESAELTVYAHEYHHDTNAVLEGWGFRKIRAAYAGNCCQIRSSGGSTHDIGWSGGKVDQSALETAAGGARATLVKLYGQGPLGIDIDFTGAEPYITDASGALLEEDGVPYYQGVSNGLYGSADFTGNEIDLDDFSFAILMRTDLESASGVSGQSTTPVMTIGGNGLHTPLQLDDLSWNVSTTINRIGQFYGGLFGWLSGACSSTKQNFLYGTLPCGYETRATQRYTAGGSGHSDFRLGTTEGLRISEVVLWSSELTRQALVDRVLRCDRNYCIGPKDTTFDGVYPSTRRAYKLLQWIDRLDKEDFLLPTVTSLTSNSVTVSSVDWSWVQIGQKLKVGTQVTGAELTVASAPVYQNGATTFQTTETTDNVATGMEVRVDPYWDGATSDVEYAAGLELKYRNASNTNRSLTNIGVNQGSTGYDAGWFALETSSGTTTDIVATDSAIIDEGDPVATGLTGGISDDGTGLRAMLLKYDISGLSERPTVAVLRIKEFTATNDSADIGAHLYVAAKAYANLSWSDVTVNWSNSPVSLSPKPSDWDDYTSLRPRKTESVYDITQSVRDAYDAGASTITIALYAVNDIDNRKATDRVVTISDVDLRCSTKQGQNIRGVWAPYQLDFQKDETHHHGWGNDALAAYNDSLPLATGKNGSPFYHWLGMARRGLSVNIMGMVRRFADWPVVSDPRTMAGLLWTAGVTLDYGASILDEATRREMEKFILGHSRDFWISQSLRPDSTNWNNANQNWKAIEGGAHGYVGMRNSADKTELALNLRGAMLGRKDGDVTATPPIWNEQTAFFRVDGMSREGTRWWALSPETDYLGRAWAHMFVAIGVTWDQSEFKWLRDAGALLASFVGANVFEEQPGVYHSPSGFCGRASGAPVTRSQDHWFGNMMVAAIGQAFYPFMRKMTSGVPEFRRTLDDAIASAVSAINATSHARGWQFRSKTSLGGLYRDWPWEDYSINYSWPAEVAEIPKVTNWHATLEALVAGTSATSFWPGTPDNWAVGVDTFPYMPGTEDFVSVRGGSGDTRWKALLQGCRQTGEFGGGGKEAGIHLFWKYGYGGVLCSHKPLPNDKYGFPEPSSEYPAPIGQDVETIIGQYDTLVYTAGGDELVSGGFGMGISSSRDNGSRTCNWSDTGVLTTTKSLEQAYSYGFLASGDSLVSTKTYHILNTAEDGMEGVRCEVSLDYSSSAPKTVLQLWHNLPCLVGTIETPNSTLSFDYWNGLAWVQVPSSSLDTWITGIQYIRLAKDWGDGNGKRYCWIILDSARNIRFPSLTTQPTGGRVKRLHVSVHPGTEGVATTLPSNTSYSWTVTTTDPGLVDTIAVATLLAPSTSSDRPHIGEPWMLRGSVQWGPKTQSSVSFEYSTDYAGDEGAASWVSIGAATENGNYWDYYGGTVPSGVLAVRIKATATDASTATSLLAVTSKAISVVLSDEFTDANGTLLSSHSPDTNTTGNAYAFTYIVPDIQGNKLDNSINGDQPDNGSFASLDVGSANWVVKGVVNTETSTGNNQGPWMGLGVNRNTAYIRANVTPDGVHVRVRQTGVSTPVITSFTSFLPSSSTDYTLEVQRIGSSFGFRLLSADGLTEHMRGAVFDIPEPVADNGPGFGISRKGIIDSVEIFT